MLATHIKDLRLMEHGNADRYLRHVRKLLDVAERELDSAEGHYISLRGLNKLRSKLNRIKA